MNSITLGIDGFKITGPKKDGEYQVTFTTGEYAKVALAKLMVVDPEMIKCVTVEIKE